MINLASAFAYLKNYLGIDTYENKNTKGDEDDDHDWMKGWKKINQIDTNLYLSSYHGASDLKVLKKLGITHILITAADYGDFAKERYPDSFKYKKIGIDDSSTENILKFFPDVFEWLDEVLKNKSNKILFHCAMGISRSAAFMVGYFMYSKKMSYHEALAYVKSARPIVNPTNFESQLLEFEKDQASVMKNIKE